MYLRNFLEQIVPHKILAEVEMLTAMCELYQVFSLKEPIKNPNKW